MPLTVIAGGQYGSEGKGKLAAYLAGVDRRPVASVRSGGSNSGHTAYRDGVAHRLRQLPCGAVHPSPRLYLAAGMVVDMPVLLRELNALGIGPDRLMIDRNATMMAPCDVMAEQFDCLGSRIGSTLSGTGATMARKVMRDSSVGLASSVPELAPYVGDVSRALNLAIDRGEHVVIEGTQGFGLSLHHGQDFPYATGRDTTAAAYLSDAGLSPCLVTDIILVLRTYPIRVAGNSGPMRDEIAWDDVRRASGYPVALAEYTTVTGRLRRVARFDWDLARRAVQVNRPTAIALHGADYLNYADYGVSSWDALSMLTQKFVQCVEERLGIPVRYVFTGPDEQHIVDQWTTATLTELTQSLPRAAGVAPA